MLGLARGAVRTLPFKRIVPYLGPPQCQTPAEGSAHEHDIARQVAWAIHHAAALTSWDSNCLAQAIAGKIMLRRRGVDSTLYLGSKNPASGFVAHAWLRCGEEIVTGGPTHEEYIVISTFGAPSSK